MATTTALVASKLDINPFSILPEELWIMVFNRVQNNETLQNLVDDKENIPQILIDLLPIAKFALVSGLTFERQKTHTYTRLGISRILDRNWCKAVTKFLHQNLPAISSHFSAGNLVGNEIAPTMVFNYLLPRHHIDPQLCSTVEQIRQFHLNLKQNGGKRSEVSLSPIKLCHEDYNHKLYIDACIALFSEYGFLFQSVSLDVSTRFIGDYKKMHEFFQDIANCFQFLPIVQKLSINITVDNSEHFRKFCLYTIQFPLLPYLENLEILSPTSPDEHDTSVQKYLLDCFIKSGYFKTRQIKTFTLLTVVHDSGHQERFKAFVKHKIHGPQNPQNLNQLFRFLFTQEKESIVVKLKKSIGDLLWWISAMQMATEELHIDTSAHARFCSISENISPLTSIRYLKLTGNLFIGFGFLTALPSLEYLHIQYRQFALNAKYPKQYRLSVVLSHYLYGEDIPGNCNIWNELPTLKLLVVEHVGNPGKPSIKHFVREYGNTPVVFTQENA